MYLRHLEETRPPSPHHCGHPSFTKYRPLTNMDTSRLSHRIYERIATAEVLTTTRLQARAGIFSVNLRCPDPELARHYARAFLPADELPETLLDITLVTASHLDLSDLVPHPKERSRLYFGADYCMIWVHYSQSILYLLDRTRQRGLVWLEANTAPAWELSRPACPLINAAALDTHWTVAHGAAVGLDGRFIMLAGSGRAGKTTAALACARAGWDYAGDDYVFTDSSNGMVAPLYASARLREDMASAFHELLASSTRMVTLEDAEARYELSLTHLAPARLRGGPIAAMLLPRRRGARRVEFALASPTDAFHALFTNTKASAPGPLASYAKKLAALAGRAPAYFVDTGPDPREIPDAFATFLTRL